MSAAGSNLVTYNFAVLRAVPHVHTGVFVNVGVVLHARTAGFLGIRVLTDTPALDRLMHGSGMDVELLARYLRASEAVCNGDDRAGPVALAPTSERFHWLTAPRSDVLQSSPVHEGVTSDPGTCLEHLYASYVR